MVRRGKKSLVAPLVGMLLLFQYVYWSNNNNSSSSSNNNGYNWRMQEEQHRSLSNNRPVVYTFPNTNGDIDWLDAWKEQWQAAGWEPIVIPSLHLAKNHPYYATLVESVPPHRATRCLQWLAVSLLLPQPDAIAHIAEPSVFPLHHDDNNDNDNALYTPFLVSGTASELTRGALLLADHMRPDDDNDAVALARLSKQDQQVLVGVMQQYYQTHRYFWDCQQLKHKRAVRFDPREDTPQQALAWMRAWQASPCQESSSTTTTSSRVLHKQLSNHDGMDNKKTHDDGSTSSSSLLVGKKGHHHSTSHSNDNEPSLQNKAYVANKKEPESIMMVQDESSSTDAVDTTMQDESPTHEGPDSFSNKAMIASSHKKKTNAIMQGESPLSFSNTGDNQKKTATKGRNDKSSFSNTEERSFDNNNIKVTTSSFVDNKKKADAVSIIMEGHDDKSSFSNAEERSFDNNNNKVTTSPFVDKGLSSIVRDDKSPLSNTMKEGQSFDSSNNNNNNNNIKVTTSSFVDKKKKKMVASSIVEEQDESPMEEGDVSPFASNNNNNDNNNDKAITSPFVDKKKKMGPSSVSTLEGNQSPNRQQDITMEEGLADKKKKTLSEGHDDQPLPNQQQDVTEEEEGQSNMSISPFVDKEKKMSSVSIVEDHNDKSPFSNAMEEGSASPFGSSNKVATPFDDKKKVGASSNEHRDESSFSNMEEGQSTPLGSSNYKLTTFADNMKKTGASSMEQQQQLREEQQQHSFPSKTAPLVDDKMVASSSGKDGSPFVPNKTTTSPFVDKKMGASMQGRGENASPYRQAEEGPSLPSNKVGSEDKYFGNNGKSDGTTTVEESPKTMADAPPSNHEEVVTTPSSSMVKKQGTKKEEKRPSSLFSNNLFVGNHHGGKTKDPPNLFASDTKTGSFTDGTSLGPLGQKNNNNNNNMMMTKKGGMVSTATKTITGAQDGNNGGFLGREQQTKGRGTTTGTGEANARENNVPMVSQTMEQQVNNNNGTPKNDVQKHNYYYDYHEANPTTSNIVGGVPPVKLTMGEDTTMERHPEAEDPTAMSPNDVKKHAESAPSWVADLMVASQRALATPTST